MAIATQQKSVLEERTAAERVSVQMVRFWRKFVELTKRVAAALAALRIQIRRHPSWESSMAIMTAA
jgi:hypothetical protein